jgi:hypothetical protein
MATGCEREDGNFVLSLPISFFPPASLVRKRSHRPFFPVRMPPSSSSQQRTTIVKACPDCATPVELTGASGYYAGNCEECYTEVVWSDAAQACVRIAPGRPDEVIVQPPRTAVQCVGGCKGTFMIIVDVHLQVSPHGGAPYFACPDCITDAIFDKWCGYDDDD